MSARPHPDDRGLAAVARVRSVRETDSRIGLQRVLAEEAAVTTRLASLHTTLAGAGAALAAPATPGELLARHASLSSLGHLLREARAAAALAADISTEARARWSADRARLAAVEHLLERRAARRRTDAARRVAREADDMAAQRWSRDHGGGAR